MRATAASAARRAAAVLLGLMVLGLMQLWAATAAPARSPGGTVAVTPQKAAAGGALTLTGWCARVLQPDGSLAPPPRDHRGPPRDDAARDRAGGPDLGELGSGHRARPRRDDGR